MSVLIPFDVRTSFTAEPAPPKSEFSSKLTINLNEELDSMHDTLDEHYTRVPETSYFKIMSCGLGPLDTMVSMESIMKFEKFNDISAIKVGEKFL